MDGLFESTYLNLETPLKFIKYSLQQDSDESVDCSLTVLFNGVEKTIEGSGNGPIEACKKALIQLIPDFSILSYTNTHLNKVPNPKQLPISKQNLIIMIFLVWN